MNRFLLLAFLLFYCHLTVAQIDSLQDSPSENQILLEDILQNTESESDFDFNTIFESLTAYSAKPLNLNQAQEKDLKELGLLTDIQIAELLQHRAENGELISLLELQSIPSFDQTTIQRILPYTAITGNLDDYQVPIGKMLLHGRNELYLRWSRNLQLSEGFTDAATEESRFLGDANRFYLRYKHAYENRMTFGVTAEKDPGEPFFKSVNKNEGFDFYSFHFFLKDYNKVIRLLAIGDYSVSLGQGLIAHSGFGYGKSNLVMAIKKSGRQLRPYSSVNEEGFLRGAGATFGIGEHVELTTFASFRSRDGNLTEQDTTDNSLEDDISSFTSLLTAGLHRNAREIADQNTIQQLTFGGSVRYSFSNGHVAVNVLQDQFDKPLLRTPAPYNLYYFNGQNLFNASFDYSFILRNFNFFGETARSDNGALATLNGLLIGLDPKADLAILHRHYDIDYQALNANGFGESTEVRNENGLYLGMVLRPFRAWEWSGYFDAYRHPWLRFRTDAPSRGYDWRMRLRYYKKRDLEVYLQIRQEIKQQNLPENLGKTDELAAVRAFQARLHLAKIITPGLELRTRLDWGFNDVNNSNSTNGFSIAQDIIYRPISIPFSFTTRFALFDTGGFATRFYNYENDLLYAFSIPAYYNRGTRFYFNLRYRGIPNLTLEARYAQTYWKNGEGFGSGVDEITGKMRSSVSAQIKYQF